MEGPGPKRTSDLPAIPKSSSVWEVFRLEMAITAEVFQTPLTEPMIDGYWEVLLDLKRDQIRNGFRRARKTLKFFPKPAEIREQADLAWDEQRPAMRQLPAAEELTPEDKARDRETWKKICADFGWEKPSAYIDLDPEEIERRKKMSKEQYIRYLIGA